MSTSAKPTARFVVVLKLPQFKVPHLLIRARAIVERMTGNPWFPSPNPSLAEVQAAIDVLADAETKTLTRVRDAASARNVKRAALVMRLQHLASYVEAIAAANLEHAAAIIESAGMHVKESGGQPPRAFSVEPGLSGELKVFAPNAGDRAAYDFEYSVDGGVTWVSVRVTKARATFRGLTPGATVHVRHRAIVKDVTGDWSDAIVVIVG